MYNFNMHAFVFSWPQILPHVSPVHTSPFHTLSPVLWEPDHWLHADAGTHVHASRVSACYFHACMRPCDGRSMQLHRSSSHCMCSSPFDCLTCGLSCLHYNSTTTLLVRPTWNFVLRLSRIKIIQYNECRVVACGLCLQHPGTSFLSSLAGVWATICGTRMATAT